MLTERELTVLRVALMQKLSRLLADIPDGVSADAVQMSAEMYNELRDLCIKLGFMRANRERVTKLLREG